MALPVAFRFNDINTDLFDQLIRHVQPSAIKSFPPYDIVKNADSKTTRITLALAGYTTDDVEIEQRSSKLIIEGKKKFYHRDNDTIVHQGIAGRPFKLTFDLSDSAKVQSADFDNGLLIIEVGEDVERVQKIAIAKR